MLPATRFQRRQKSPKEVLTKGFLQAGIAHEPAAPGCSRQLLLLPPNCCRLIPPVHVRRCCSCCCPCSSCCSFWLLALFVPLLLLSLLLLLLLLPKSNHSAPPVQCCSPKRLKDWEAEGPGDNAAGPVEYDAQEEVEAEALRRSGGERGTAEG